MAPSFPFSFFSCSFFFFFFLKIGGATNSISKFSSACFARELLAMSFGLGALELRQKKEKGGGGWFRERA